MPHAKTKDTALFESPYVKINEHGIDLIKNYQVHKHIEFREIVNVVFKKGRLINNWLTSLILSFSLTCFSLIWGINSTLTFNINNIISPYIRSYMAINVVTPWILFVGGLIWIYVSFKSSPVICINTFINNYRIPIKEFEKNNHLNDLIDFLSDRVELINTYNTKD